LKLNDEAVSLDPAEASYLPDKQLFLKWHATYTHIGIFGFDSGRYSVEVPHE
jgi:hypothetical protein